MNKVIRFVMVSLLFFLSQNNSFTQESKKGHSHAAAEIHGGSVVMTKQYHFEVVFKTDAIQLYLYDGVQKPLSVAGVEGDVTLKFKEGEPQTLPLHVTSMHHKMKGEHKEMNHGNMHDKKDHKMMIGMNYLQTKIDLSKVDAGTMKAVFSLKGLPNKKETEATFTETFTDHVGKKESGHNDHGGHKH